MPADAAARLAAEQEVENLSGLSPNPEKDIFVVRENRTTCLMAEFAAKFIVPYDVWASNYVDVSGGRVGPEAPGMAGETHTHICRYFGKVLYPLRGFSTGAVGGLWVPGGTRGLPR